MGKNVAHTLESIEQQYDWLRLDKCVIMPNHIHLFLRIGNDGPPGGVGPCECDIAASHFHAEAFYRQTLRNRPLAAQIFRARDLKRGRLSPDPGI